MDELELIYRDPDFLEVVRELLVSKEEAPPSEEDRADEVTQRVRRMILLRMKRRSSEKEAHITVTAG